MNSKKRVGMMGTTISYKTFVPLLIDLLVRPVRLSSIGKIMHWDWPLGRYSYHYGVVCV